MQVSSSRTTLAHETSTASAVSGRARSFASARRHTGFVRLLKVAIPIGSIVAVGAVAFATFYKPFNLPGLTLGPISISGSKIAMESPRLTGFRKDNRPYEVTATTAFQDIRKPNVIELKEMRARLATDDAGGIANLVSKAGVFDTGKEHLDLSQDIRIWTDKGEEVLLRTASFDLKAGTGHSHDPVRITTPTLTLEADGLELADGGKTLAFTGRVRTRLIPGPDGGRSRARAAPDGTTPPAKITQAEAGDRP